MRTDEHCLFSPGFDQVMTQSCQPNWIMTLRRYYLDPVKWARMDLEPVDYEKLVVQTVGQARKFTGFPWAQRAQKRRHALIDETMAMQGSMWLMPRSWWDKVIGDLQSQGYGTHYQDSHEMVFKTWKAGGKLVVNKNGWFAHKHNSFPRTHSLSHGRSQKELQKFFDAWYPYYQEIKRKWRI